MFGYAFMYNFHSHVEMLELLRPSSLLDAQCNTHCTPIYLLGSHVWQLRKVPPQILQLYPVLVVS